MKYAIIILIIMLACSCSGNSQSKAATASASAAKTEAYTERGAFSADSAYAYAARQVEFGPRVPGTASHRKCADWLISQLESYGAEVSTQLTEVTAWNGDRLPLRNIFARFNPKATARVLLVAHYDTRPWADQDPDPAKRDKPIDGANDGASGVAVLLEIARNLALEPASIGVDILLNDCEDYGARDEADLENTTETWCLGTQYFAKNMPFSVADMPRYGILLDIVGGRAARFHREYYSAYYAPTPTAKVWGMAQKLGLSDRFPMAIGGAAVDDHIPLIGAGIQTADIIENTNPQTNSFPPTWHTHADNMDNLDKESLGVVGRVVLNVIYNEKP